MKKVDFRSLSKEVQAEIRRRAVCDYLSLGKRSKAKLARMYQVTPNIIAKWIKNYEKSGRKSFTKDTRGAKRYQNTVLTKQQQNWLKKQLITKTPDQLQLPFSLWTRKLVGEVVFRKYGIKISISTTGKYLKSFGMTPQKPMLKSYKQQPDQIKEWLDVQYPKVERKAKASKAMIFWGDETGIRSKDQVGRGYSIKGEKPVQKQGGYRFGVNMVSAINNGGGSRFMLFSGKMNSKKFIEFLRRLLKDQKQKIILIIDNAPFHKSAIVKAWTAKHGDKIELVFLPTYSPELNPDEYLNNALKQKLNYRQKATTPKQLAKTVSSIMKNMQASKTSIKNLFKHEKVKYAA